MIRTLRHLLCCSALSFGLRVLSAEDKIPRSETEITFPPRLPNGAEMVTDGSVKLLQAPEGFPADVAIASEAPTIDFAYYPGQDYPGKPWSAWGDSLAVNGKYYSAIGDHLAPGNAFLYEYDPATKKFRQLLDLKKLLNLPEGHYTPGKIHSRIDLGQDGWLYCSTHRGSTKITTDAYHYGGDWIVRCNPATGEAQVVTHGPVPKHCIPCSVLDPKRMIFYGGTAPGSEDDPRGIQFFAYNVRSRKVQYAGPNGPARYMIFAASTGRVYFNPGKDDELVRYDPERATAPERIPARIGIRAATEETADGFVYTVSQGQAEADATLYAFNTKSEQAESLGAARVGTEDYIASIDIDPTGRYLYYIPGAHGGADRDGSAVLQFDVKRRTKKVVAFLHPFYSGKYGVALKGTYTTALDPAGDKLYITWNASRGSKAWDTCALTIIHIPESER